MFRSFVFFASLVLIFSQAACNSPDSSAQGESESSGESGSQAQQAEKPQVDVQQLLAKLQKGVDVSRFSGQIDWQQVAQEGFGFAVSKATEGVDLKDSTFDAHWQGIKEAGLLRGAYHFYVTEDPPEDQAKWFIENVQLEPGDLVPVVDIELIGHDTKLEGLPQRLRTFVELIEAHYGVKPIIYTSPNFWDKHFKEAFHEHPLWIAEYGVTEPRVPQGWPTWHLWQHQGDVNIPGIEKDADLTRGNNNAADLSSLIIR
ncbi:MAG TPA: GH25 family lysozyme [Acidobacteriota bacterium]|nr:GH25 family lysozyme [Acidobacteriota bacterium]